MKLTQGGRDGHKGRNKSFMMYASTDRKKIINQKPTHTLFSLGEYRNNVIPLAPASNP